MSSITKEQLLAAMYGVLIKNSGGTASQVFKGIPGSTLLAKGKEGLAATLAASTADVTLTTGTTEGLAPGMVLTKTSAGGGSFFNATGVRQNVIHSIQSSTEFKVGNFAEFAVHGLKATLDNTANTVTLTSGTTENLRIGMKLTKVTVTGELGAFNTTNAFVLAITGLTTFTVGSSLSNAGVVSTNANHSANGAVTFYAGGTTSNHTAGAITFAAGGIDLTNGQLPGLGDPTRQTLTLATSNELINRVSPATNNILVCLNGGNLETANSTLGTVEMDYHYTGQILRRKLK